MPVVNPGIRRFLASAIQRLFNGASFYAPLTHSLVPTRGTGTPTFTRATTATVRDHEGVLRTAIAGEARFEGARRVYNLIADPNAASRKSNDFTLWTTNNATAVGNEITFGAPASAGSYIYTGGSLGSGNVAFRTYIASATVSCATGTEAFKLGINDTGAATHVSDDFIATTTPQRVSFVKTLGGTNVGVGMLITNSSAGGVKTIIVENAQVEDITGRADQTTPSEYVSVGVLSAPYHGAGVDGVKYFDTDLSGNPIPASTLLGYLAEGARTNHFLQSGTPATQTSGALSTGTYTLWMDGTGSIAVAGATATITGAGTATSSTAVTFVVTVAGTVTYTVTGSPTRAQSENGAQRSSYIPTTTLAVARNADVLSYSGVSDLVTLASIGFTPPATAVAGTNFTLMSLQDSSVVSNSVIMRVNGSTLKPELVTFSGSVLQVAETHTSALTNAPHKFIASVATNNTFSVIDGGDVKVDTSCTAPSGVTTLYIGSYPSDQWFNGNIKGIYGWTRNLSQAEAKAVTV